MVYEKDIYYYHPDHLGSSTFISDADGELYQHLENFPFGETWVEESTNTQRTPYHFTAKELDEETGLYYFGARYYDPRTSVWQSPDPILGDYLPTGDKERDKNLPGMGGVFNSVNLNLFHYSRNNPVNYIDYDGNEDSDVDKFMKESDTGIIDNIAQFLTDDAIFAGPGIDATKVSRKEQDAMINKMPNGRTKHYGKITRDHDINLHNSGGTFSSIGNKKVRAANVELAKGAFGATNKADSFLGKINPVSRIKDVAFGATFGGIALVNGLHTSEGTDGGLEVKTTIFEVNW
ncbi:MAG: RHS repeat-associated core domain-containing protein [Candidatus Electrothrix sp. AR1]|nr:RHS repeat-associated core domain-containing protein [Candidatus Electrothrix sp. AR1]